MMFVIYTLADVRCLREARAAPAALLDTVESELRDRHRNLGNGESVDEFSLTESGALVILQAGDGPGVYDALGLSEMLPEPGPMWIGHRDDGHPVTYRVIELQDTGKTVRLYLPANTPEDTPWAP